MTRRPQRATRSGRGWRGAPVRSGTPHRSPRSGCGSWISSRPGAPFYNIACAIPVRVPLDLSALERALNDVVRRHEALRTTFPARDGRPEQVVAPALEVPLALLDLRALPPAEREAEAGGTSRPSAQVPFDLATGPLLRSGDRAAGVTPTTCCCCRMHHIISDGWSMGVLVRELCGLYAAYAAARRRRCRRCRSSTPTTRSGSASGCRARCWRGQLAYWQRAAARTRRRCSSCRPTGPARRVQTLPRRAADRSHRPPALTPRAAGAEPARRVPPCS